MTKHVIGANCRLKMGCHWLCQCKSESSNDESSTGRFSYTPLLRLYTKVLAGRLGVDDDFHTAVAGFARWAVVICQRTRGTISSDRQLRLREPPFS